MTEANLRGVAPEYEQMIAVLAQNWWAIGIRGVLGILFGLIALFLPGATMLSLVLVFAAYAFVDGVFGIVSAVRAAREHERWGYLLLEGLVDIAAAAVAVLWPGITVVVFVFLVAFWAIFTGILELAAAFRLEFIDGRGWLIFGGIVSVLYGAVLIVAPMIGAVVLTWWLGAYALIFGVALVVLAFKLRARLEKPRHGSAA
ncbi:MAG TPA: HdeD family acid-resistance protein [Xanthobacteraceae bacterium]|nr:HdeD family acid-resistance protein [Xanthobacteraceae bacterium]